MNHPANLNKSPSCATHVNKRNLKKSVPITAQRYPESNHYRANKPMTLSVSKLRPDSGTLPETSALFSPVYLSPKSTALSPYNEATLIQSFDSSKGIYDKFFS